MEILTSPASSLAKMLTFDTSGIELYVTENNPKTLNALIKKLKAYYKDKPDVDPYKMAYGLMPSQAASCPDAKQMYINGHFCYADKFAILTNGLGIVRHISFIDDADFKAAHEAVQADINFSKVALSADSVADNKLMLLQGWAPEKSLDTVREYLDKTGHYYQIDDPTQEDDIPIQLSNNKFFRLFEPLTKLYMLPKYGELDLTMFFAPFFMLFFGLCLGDMGYGALIMLALPVFTKLFQLINPDFKSSLVFLFGLSTVLAGSLTGTAFGFSLYDIDLPFFQKMKDMLYQDNQAMFYLSLIIGCVQILFGMVLKAVNLAIQLGFKYAVSTIGWILLLVGIAVGVLTGSMGEIWFMVLMIVAGCMIMLYNSPGKNIFLNIGLGLWDAYNMVTGLLGDVLSYVRLFALGLSGGILASVFNSLAVGMSPDIPVVGFLVTALIFVAGHGLNIFMNILGSMVHPMRLTFVEFFKNSGYEGGGQEYKPFKK